MLFECDYVQFSFFCQEEVCVAEGCYSCSAPVRSSHRHDKQFCGYGSGWGNAHDLKMFAYAAVTNELTDIWAVVFPTSRYSTAWSHALCYFQRSAEKET